MTDKILNHEIPVPKGTTYEQWVRYKADCEAHEEYVKQKGDNLSLAIWLFKGPFEWTGEQIELASKIIKEEISRATHMDRPNEPGYYRANND